MPSPPWIPVGNAALLAALGLFLLSLAVLVVIPVLMGRRYRLLAWTVGLAMSLSVIPPAAATWLSAQGGQPVTDIPRLAPAQGFWGMGWPIALMVLAVVVALWMLDTSVGPRPPAKWQLLVLLCLAVNSPWVEYLATAFVMLYMSHDTTPRVQ